MNGTESTGSGILGLNHESTLSSFVHPSKGKRTRSAKFDSNDVRRTQPSETSPLVHRSFRLGKGYAFNLQLGTNV